jgi:hypothetical protein
MHTSTSCLEGVTSTLNDIILSTMDWLDPT